MTVYSSEFYELLQYGCHQSAILYTFMFADSMKNNNERDYLDLHPDGTISYLDANKSNPYRDNFSCPGRVSGRPARIARSLIPQCLLPMFDDTDFEEFANVVKTYLGRNHGTFRMIPAADIPYWYHNDRLNRNLNTGSLGQSCMRHDHCQEYLKFYTTLGEAVSLLILTNDTNALLGRALVWKATNGNTYMDRAYGTEATVRMFHDYARSQGWWKKTDDTYSTPRNYTDPEGNRRSSTFRVRIPTLSTTFPYLDTLKYLDFSRRTISNSRNNAHLILDDTGGGYSPTDRYYHDVLGYANTRDEILRLIWNKYDPTTTLPLELSTTDDENEGAYDDDDDDV